MGCPVATDAGRYVQLIAEKRDEEAYLVARAPNPFASVCGRVCAAPCEDACRRGSIDAPISIRALKRFVTEKYGVESVHPDTQDRLRGELVSEGNRYAGHLPVHPVSAVPAVEAVANRKVAVIGAGPAGLSAAHDLALLGYAVTVFEAAEEPGGMMRFGIPEYRLPRTLIRSEIDRIAGLGVDIRLGHPLAEGFGLKELRAEGYESVFLSVGVSKGRDLRVPGVELDGVVKAVDYLLNVNRGYRMDLGRRVVVIGGGFVAFDAARTALRLSREEEAAAPGGRGPQGPPRRWLGRSSQLGRRRPPEGGVRLGARGPARRSERGDDRLARDLRRDAGLEDDAGARGVRGSEEGGDLVQDAPGPRAFRGSGRLSAIELKRVLSVFDENGRFAPALRRKRGHDARGGRVHPGHRAAARTSRS